MTRKSAWLFYLFSAIIVVIPTGFICVTEALLAQEPAAVAQAPALAGSGLDSTPQPTWLAKVNAAVTDTTDLALTAEETAAMVAAYSAALRQRPGDMAVSATTCYVLGVNGTVLMSTPLRQGSDR